MCGIFGGWQRSNRPEFESRLNGVLADLAHRGPDDHGCEIHHEHGVVGLGHTRLSILDLTSAGHQPMRSPDKRWSIVFNGEIYNYRELRSELGHEGVTFASDCDTEVLLAAWQKWGESCIERFVGMFAFVIYDHVEGTITAVRDAFGIKPLFYAHDENQFVFASELPALLQLRGDQPTLNWQRAHDYLIYGVHDSQQDTFVEGVQHLPPAHVLRFDLTKDREPTIERWWTPQIEETSTLSFDEAVDAVRETFLDSVRLHLRSDVPVGAALSGGVDSSALVCAMRYLEPDMPIHTFSFLADDKEISEQKWVDVVNDHVDAVPHPIHVRSDDLCRDLPDLIRTQGEPFGTTSIYAQYRVFREAHEQQVPVIIEGQGADELLAGYQGYPGQRMRSLLEQFRWREMFSFAKAWREWPGRNGQSAWRALVGQLLPDSLFRRGLAIIGHDTTPSWLDDKALSRRDVALRPRRPVIGRRVRGRRVAEALASSLCDDTLPSLLRYGDRNAMRYSIENRVPFLTTKMADFLLSLPEEFLISGTGETKRVFRAAMRGIVPDPVLDRRDKIGFVTPMHRWVRDLSVSVRQAMSATTQFAFLSPQKMTAAFDEVVRSEQSLSSQMWRLINLSQWTQQLRIN